LTNMKQLCVLTVLVGVWIVLVNSVSARARPEANPLFEMRLDTTKVSWDTIPLSSNAPLLALDTCGGRIIAASTEDVVFLDESRKHHVFQPLKHVALSDVLEINGMWFAASATSGVSHSTNRGMTWHLDHGVHSPKAVSSLKSLNGNLVVLTTSGEIHLRDTTSTWSRISTPIGPVRQLASTNSTLFAITDSAVSYMHVGGNTWHPLVTGKLRKPLIASFGDTCVVVLNDSLYRIIIREDRSTSLIRTSIEQSGSMHLAYGLCGLVLTTDRMVYQLDANGRLVSLPRGPWAETKRTTSCDCVDDRIAVSTNDPAARVLVMHPTRDSKWSVTTLITRADTDLDVIGVRGTPSGGLFIRARRQGLWHSADTGRFALNVSNPMTGVRADAMVRTGNNFFVSTLFGGTIAVINCGERVERVSKALPFAVGTMVVSVADSILVACLLKDRYYASYNNGVSWTQITAPDTFGIVDKMFGIGNTVYLANPKGLRYAEAPHFAWRELERPSECLNVQQMMAYRGGLLLNCMTGTFHKRSDGQWTSLKLPDAEGPALLNATVVTGETLIGAGKTGLYKTDDGGETWSFIPTPTRRRFIVLGVFKGEVWGFVDNGTICHGKLP